jgi:hypothetical protein
MLSATAFVLYGKEADTVSHRSSQNLLSATAPGPPSWSPVNGGGHVWIDVASIGGGLWAVDNQNGVYYQGGDGTWYYLSCCAKKIALKD